MKKKKKKKKKRSLHLFFSSFVKYNYRAENTNFTDKLSSETAFKIRNHLTFLLLSVIKN